MLQYALTPPVRGSTRKAKSAHCLLGLSGFPLDVFAEVPKEIISEYDIIHLRLFLLVVRDNDPSPLLKNVLKMLSEWTPSRRTLLSR